MISYSTNTSHIFLKTNARDRQPVEARRTPVVVRHPSQRSNPHRGRSYARGNPRPYNSWFSGPFRGFFTPSPIIRVSSPFITHATYVTRTSYSRGGPGDSLKSILNAFLCAVAAVAVATAMIFTCAI